MASAHSCFVGSKPRLTPPLPGNTPSLTRGGCTGQLAHLLRFADHLPYSGDSRATSLIGLSLSALSRVSLGAAGSGPWAALPPPNITPTPLHQTAELPAPAPPHPVKGHIPCSVPWKATNCFPINTPQSGQQRGVSGIVSLHCFTSTQTCWATGPARRRTGRRVLAQRPSSPGPRRTASGRSKGGRGHLHLRPLGQDPGPVPSEARTGRKVQKGRAPGMQQCFSPRELGLSGGLRT